VKGVEELIDAAALVLQEHSNCFFIHVGEGELRPQVEAKVSALRISDRILFPGRRSDVPRLLSACDLAVLSSRAEGFSNAILEYMAAGLPVVATDVGGNREALGNDSGFLVPARNPQALAQAISQLVADRNLRVTIGEAAAHRARTLFSTEQSIERLVEYYAELVERTRPGQD
jgi:glycosyltransferase involved in cell wall biosynthesis